MTDAMLGAIFASLGAEEQAEFLNGAGKALRRGCDGPSGIDMQACWIVDRLDGNGRDLVKRLASFIQHDEETPRIEKRIEVVREGATFMEIPEGICGFPMRHISGRVFLCTREPHGGETDHENAEHCVGGLEP